MKKRILLTCFGGKSVYDVVRDLDVYTDIEVFVADANPHAMISSVAKRFVHVPSGDDPQFVHVLLDAAKTHGIDMIIPGGDEDAFAMMGAQQCFAEAGILTAVQDPSLLEVFKSKSGQYTYLMEKGFPIPAYRCVRNRDEFTKALEALGYPARTILMKPNTGRGGNGILLLAERFIRNRDNLPLINQEFAIQQLDGVREFILMEYFEGVVYDIDVLTYKNGERYFGQRRRLSTNVTKLFSGNRFECNAEIDHVCRRLYEALPTNYLVDYDLMIGDNGMIQLLEVNPRPSGSTVSYIPFGVNLYYILAKSYLDNKYIKVPDTICGNSVAPFYTMLKGI